MTEITTDMEAIIKQAMLSFVATTNEDGTPSLSPKASLTVRDGHFTSPISLRLGRS
ncbi:hypothetical protein [Mesorhizobium sp. WSM3224]|uniref:hypothetical protein n=1 Tax=Mesorhizobium sp. WSM3224 TaxID=1040986 RepID=UPI000408A263|nr:hypothetical protein [Mesorhizobium sp. WSM3224]